MKPETAETSAQMRVLVAEDDPLAAQVLEITARKAGIVIETVANGLDAADRIATAPAHFYDAVLLDMRMPVLGGREAARQIRDLPAPHGTLPIYAMSASENELVSHPWATWLFDGHLAKPLKPGDLLALKREQGRADTPEPDHRSAIIERLEAGLEQIDDAVAIGDFATASEAARHMRLALLGLVPEALIRALHVFQLSQAHGRREASAIEELRQCVAAARTLLKAA